MNIIKSYRVVFFLFFFIVVLFYSDTFLNGKLPVPSDALVGLYHPWRDYYNNDYPRGIPYKNFLITDPIRQQIPWRKEAISMLQQGSLPLWSSNSFSGIPLLGNIQSGSLYPFNIIFFFFSFSTSWTLLIILQSICSGVFLVIFLRRLKLHPIASLIAAIAWCFSGFSIAWLTWGTIVQTAMWLPLCLYAIDSWREERRYIYVLLYTISLSMSFLAGHVQIFLYIWITTIVYACYRAVSPSNITAFNEYKQYLFGLCIGLFSFVVLTSIQWIPLAHSLDVSSRIQENNLITKEGWFLPWKHSIALIIPDFFGNPATLNYWGSWNYGELSSYIGIIPWIFLIFGILFSRRDKYFWIGLAGLTLFFLFPTPIAYLPFTYSIPIFSTLQPTRLLVIVIFSFVILAAYGIDSLLNQYSLKRVLITFFIGSVCFSIPWILFIGSNTSTIMFIPHESLLVVKRNLVLPSVFFGLGILLILMLNLRRLRVISLILIIAVTSFDLLRFGWKFTPFTPRSLFFPTTKVIEFLKQEQQPLRVITIDDRIMPPASNNYYSIESVGGYDPLSPKRYEAFIAAMERGRPDISEPFGFNRIVTPKYIDSLLFPHLSAEYVLSLQEMNTMNLVFSEGETKVYKTENALPRAYFATNIITQQNDEDIIKTMYDSSFIPGNDAIVEQNINVEKGNVKGEVIDFAQNNSSIQLRVVNNGPMLLVINIPYDPWWNAYVNNEKALIYRTNFAFMGVVVPSGQHTITLQYELRFN